MGVNGTGAGGGEEAVSLSGGERRVEDGREALLRVAAAASGASLLGEVLEFAAIDLFCLSQL